MYAETLWWGCHRKIIADYFLIRGVDVTRIQPWIIRERAGCGCADLSGAYTRIVPGGGVRKWRARSIRSIICAAARIVRGCWAKPVLGVM
jgi:hypothetical protein